jgi:hypothetical protein
MSVLQRKLFINVLYFWVKMKKEYTLSSNYDLVLIALKLLIVLMFSINYQKLLMSSNDFILFFFFEKK